MSDEIAPFEDEPLTVEEALEQLTVAVNLYNTAVNVANELPLSAIAHYAVVIDERLYTEAGVVPDVSILEPTWQPSYITNSLIKEAYQRTHYVTVEYDPDDED